MWCDPPKESFLGQHDALELNLFFGMQNVLGFVCEDLNFCVEFL